ncbi:hypothetical protein A33O_11365 [Nitratireductor aquibiodomus RA22]|uniref:Uncharacterized protein n=1 Tax=Nitratireductor aquibiodomus RA22 TaxID=1189611 RepID=I5BY86_9HYPH|nr:hypothetical protein [Nitratireductor aquibiodomus]EIM74538.1 hypothetical protein A33O_11365 [Nitratireductor aquibiodomus RA22]
MKRVLPQEFNGRKDQKSFKEIEFKGEEIQELADNYLIIRTMYEIISVSPIATMNIIEAISLAEARELGHLSGMSIPKYALVGMLVSYARCFSSGVVTIKPEDHFSNEEIEQHKQIIALRSKYAAHDVSSIRENHVSVRVSENTDEFLISPSVGDVIFGPEHAIQIQRLAEAVIASLEARNAELDKMVEAEVRKKGIEKLRALPARVSKRRNLGHINERRDKSHE